MIARLRSLADALEFYLRTNGQAAVDISNRTRHETDRLRQAMRLEEQHAKLSERTVVATETSNNGIASFIEVLRGMGPAISRIEGKLGTQADPSGSVTR